MSFFKYKFGRNDVNFRMEGFDMCLSPFVSERAGLILEGLLEHGVIEITDFPAKGAVQISIGSVFVEISNLPSKQGKSPPNVHDGGIRSQGVVNSQPKIQLADPWVYEDVFEGMPRS